MSHFAKKKLLGKLHANRIKELVGQIAGVGSLKSVSGRRISVQSHQGNSGKKPGAGVQATVSSS